MTKKHEKTVNFLFYHEKTNFFSRKESPKEVWDTYKEEVDALNDKD